MKKIKILFLATILLSCISCDMAVESIKESATKIIEEKKAEVDSTINNNLNKSLNSIDTLLNYKKK